MNNIELFLDQLMAKDTTAIQTIPTDKLHPFPQHSFKVQDNEEMTELTESIKELGVLTPLVIRPLESEEYEVVSGHRRLFACKKLGIHEVPAIVHPSIADRFKRIVTSDVIPLPVKNTDATMESEYVCSTAGKEET